MRNKKQETTHVRRRASLATGWWTRLGILGLLLAATSMVSPAQDEQASTQSVKFTTLHIFDGTDGSFPEAPLIQATDGNLYGTATNGGANGDGTVFKITPGGTLTTLYSFCSQSGCTDGSYPFAPLVQGTDGNLYGATGGDGGVTSYGTVFKITPSGTLTTLHNFDGTDGEYPSWLIQATNGDFYGTTSGGGANGDGTVFKITPSGTLTSLHSFDGTDGEGPTGLIQASNGDLYGTTFGGGAGGYGTVFKITPGGTLTTLHSFAGYPKDGAHPFAPPVQATNGDFYGTTYVGGANDVGSVGGSGTVFKITPGGTLTTLYSFCPQSGCPDGQLVDAGLVQATDGSFYGTTSLGGSISPACAKVGGGFGCGTVFKITPSGTLTTLHSFCSQSGCLDGDASSAGLVQDTNGSFYGTTGNGGNLSCKAEGPGCGIVFRLSVGLGPFVETQPTSGKVETAVKILGTNLTGATKVTFNGTAAVFKVVSSSLITTTVPHDATTGKVEVTTPHGTLSSNVVFRVTCP